MPLSVPAAAAARLFRYDLNQIPKDYTVEVRNRFKGLELIEIQARELWMEVRDIVQDTGIKTIPKKKKYKKEKSLSEEALQIAMKRSKKQRRKGKIYPFECGVPENSQGEIRKPSSAISEKK